MFSFFSGSEPAAATPSPSEVDAQGQDQVVLILCGLIASGKSTFAEALQQHCPRFRRCNQDDLGDRRAVENLARESLAQGLSVCVDRTNFNAAQRAYWINIAREFPGTKVWVIVFDTPYETCVARLQTRTAHPTIKSPAEGLSVLARFASDFRAPRPHEGYDRILFLRPADHPAPEYTAEDVAAILLRVRNAPPIVPPAQGEYRQAWGYGGDNFRYFQGGGGAGGGGGGGGAGGGRGRSGRGGGGGGGGGYYNSRGRGGYGGRGGGGGGYGGYSQSTYNAYNYNSRGEGAAHRGAYAYRGDGVGLYGGRRQQQQNTTAPSAPSASSSSTPAPTPAQGADAATGTGAGVQTVGTTEPGHPREDVFPIDD